MTYTENREYKINVVKREIEEHLSFLYCAIRVNANCEDGGFIRYEEERLKAYKMAQILNNSRLAYSLLVSGDKDSRLLADVTNDMCMAAIDLRIALNQADAETRKKHFEIAMTYCDEAADKYDTYKARTEKKAA